MAPEVDVEFPDTLSFLFEPHRYKIAYGGRGGAKSWNFARALIARAVEEKTLILCAREIQKSIDESVYRLLVDQIQEMGLSGFFEVQKTKIIGQNGSEFVFAGLRGNTDNLKSYEGVDIVWIEEAHVVSRNSWEKLIPTIRKAGSEIWVTFNPELEDDETYQRFVADPPNNAFVRKVNWRDNPWFPDVLNQERLDARRRMSDADYEHIWEGKPKQAVEGAIFAAEMTKAAEEHRITRVPVKEGIPVNTFWDLGQSDSTCIWFVQLVGMEYRVIDYFEGSGEKFPYYIGILQKRGYTYGEHFMPHDAEHEQLAAQASIKRQLEQALRDNPDLGKGVRIVPRVAKKYQGIEAARDIFERCFFDKEKCADGLQCLRRYRYAKNPETGRVGKEPLHDQWSHGADAFMQLAQHAKPPAIKRKQIKVKTKWIK